MRLNFTTILLVSFIQIGLSQSVPQTKAFAIKGGTVTKEDVAPDLENARPKGLEMPKQGRDKQEESSDKKMFYIKKQATIDLSEETEDYYPQLLIKEMPKQSGQKIVYYNYPQNKSAAEAKSQATVNISPLALNQNDNDMAISNEGRLISVINSNIYFRNTNNDSIFPKKSLYSFKFPVSTLNSDYDPKVMYDPKADRFVLVCLVGTLDTNSKVIVGFSKSNKPNGQWNLYVLPGNPIINGNGNDTLWTDYPMISMTEKELFLTVNLLYNNTPWQTGFAKTVIWQMKKDSGYAGKAVLGSVLHTNIKYNGKHLRNLCPVKGGSKLHSPNMYFISNRNFASQNDSVFLVNVTDTIGAPNATLTVKAVVNSQPYYFANDALQPNATNSLATNDSRNLGAFFENNKIQYVHNTKNPANNRVSIYYGVIDNPQSTNPTASGYILPNDNGMYFAYPNISYCGNSPADNNAIITFNHSSSIVFPGCSAIQADAAGGFSPILNIKDGATYINILTSDLERWGDYSGSQRRYNNPGEVWMSGYYAQNGAYPKVHAAWLAQIFTDEKFASIKDNSKNSNSGANVFPNPTKDIYTVQLKLIKPEYLNFELFDIQGKLVQVLLRDWVKVLDNEFSFDTQNLKAGVYQLKITGNNATNIVKKIVIN
jgi:Secretion system C-terminal sorting domain